VGGVPGTVVGGVRGDVVLVLDELVVVTDGGGDKVTGVVRKNAIPSNPRAVPVRT
jgi:hypothetical protein